MSAATFSAVVSAFILLFLSDSHISDTCFLAWHPLVVLFKTDRVGLWRITFGGHLSGAFTKGPDHLRSWSFLHTHADVGYSVVLWHPSFWWETRVQLACSYFQDHLLAFPLGSFLDALIFLKMHHFTTISFGTALSAFLLSPCNLSFWMLLPLPSLPPSGSPSIWDQAMRDHHSPWLLAFVFFFLFTCI